MMVLSSSSGVSKKVILSEIEKYFISCVFHDDFNIRKYKMDSGLPESFFNKVINHLVEKRIIALDLRTLDVKLKDLSFYSMLSEEPCYINFTFKKDSVAIITKRNITDTLSKIKSIYKNALDFYVLGYIEESFRHCQKIWKIVKNHLIKNIYDILLDLDLEMILFLEDPTYQDSLLSSRFFGELILNFFLKIINLIEQEEKRINNGPEFQYQNADFKSLYTLQRREIENLKKKIKKYISKGKKYDGRVSSDLFGYAILYFHKKIGPIIYYSESIDDEELLEQICKLMDIFNNQVFSYTIGDFNTLNYQFEIKSPVARGRNEYLQFSLIFNKIFKNDELFFKGKIREICDKAKKIEDVYKIFYIEDNKDDAIILRQLKSLRVQFLQEFKFFNTFLKR
ncbi:MAG: hypothetical protein ACTSYF_15190 [Promethearchaeota archaeon]